MSDRCKMPDGVSVKPDGVNDLDPCRYETIDECVTPKYGYQFRVMRCVNCGNIDIAWARPGNPF